ncbi:MAG: ketopantoate reductase family protein, partial [Acidiferrobacterales bacterium]
MIATPLHPEPAALVRRPPRREETQRDCREQSLPCTSGERQTVSCSRIPTSCLIRIKASATDDRMIFEGLEEYDHARRPSMKILVYGAGVLGSLYAARLKEAGNDVAVLDRPKRLGFIRDHGILFEDVLTGK